MKDKGFSLDLNAITHFPDGGIFSKVLAKSKTYNMTLLCLAKGTDMDTHTSTKTGCVQVLKGKGTFVLYDQRIDLKPGGFIFMLKNAPHSLEADEDLAFLLCLTD